MPFTPEHYVQRIRERNLRKPRQWRGYLKGLAVETRAISGREKSLKSGFVWDDGRNYADHYNPFFSFALSRFLHTNVTDMAKGVAGAIMKPKLHVLEDGVGRGAFLSELKPVLHTLGVRTHTTGLYVEKTNARLEKARAKIDELHRGLAEHYIPRKKIDLFISLSGSIQETLPAHQMNHILKFASAVNPGGMMLVGLVRGRLDIGFDIMLVRLKQTLRREGFRTEAYKIPNSIIPGVTLPNYALVAQRRRHVIYPTPKTN